MKSLLSLVIMMSIAAACGTSSGGGSQSQRTESSGNGPYGSFWVTDVASLPTCDDTKQGALGYVKDEGKFYACDSGEWAEVEIKGAPGKDGTDNKIVASLYCAANLSQATAAASGLTVPAGGLDFKYDAALLASGDVFVSAEIRNDSTQVSGTNFYSASQNGASTAQVILVDDWYSSATYGWWRISVDRTTLITTVIYNDDLPTTDTRAFYFPAASCTLNQY